MGDHVNLIPQPFIDGGAALACGCNAIKMGLDLIEILRDVLDRSRLSRSIRQLRA
jgi:hypothetical protein